MPKSENHYSLFCSCVHCRINRRRFEFALEPGVIFTKAAIAAFDVAFPEGWYVCNDVIQDNTYIFSVSIEPF